MTLGLLHIQVNKKKKKNYIQKIKKTKNKIIFHRPCPLHVQHEIHHNVSFVLIQIVFFVLK